MNILKQYISNLSILFLKKCMFSSRGSDGYSTQEGRTATKLLGDLELKI